MKRRHLEEIHDQPWCPAEFRDGLTDLIRFTIRFLHIYDPILPILAKTIELSKADRILDLCSGAGGPWIAWARRKQLPPVQSICLTDMFPNAKIAASLRPPFQYHPTPVDAMHVDSSLPGVRTLFTSLHHFRPAEVVAILKDAAANRQPIGVFEFTNRSVLAAALLLLTTPLFSLLLTLRYFPSGFRRWLWTFVIPVIPLMTTYDGVISCLRSYRPNELLEMARAAAPEDYEWISGTKWGWLYPVPITYLIGVPRKADGPSLADSIETS